MRQLSRHISLLFCLLFVGQALSAQDCRLNLDKLEPVILRFNPFFTRHQWDPLTHIESAYMDEDRILVISQRGCKRHFTNFSLVLSPDSYIDQPQFWIDEVQSMMRSVFFENDEYALFGEDFEQTFAQKIKIHGTNSEFNFPVRSLNFICEIELVPYRGAIIRIQMIRYLFKEKILLPGIPRKQDDGWFIAEPDSTW